MWLNKRKYEVLCRQQEIDRKEVERLRNENCRLENEVSRLKERLSATAENQISLQVKLADAQRQLSSFSREHGDKGRFVKK